LSSVPRSLQIVKNQKKKERSYKMSYQLTSCTGENNSDLSLMFGLTQELKKKKNKEYFVSIFLDMQGGLTK